MIPTTSGRYLPPDFFIKENIKKLEKKILQLSEDQINDLLKEIYRLAHQEFFEQARLRKLLKNIKKKTQYYYKRQYQPYNYRAFVIAVMLSIILFTTISFYVLWCNKNIWLLIGIMLITFYLLKKIHQYIHIFLNPRYKEYYEKYAFIEQKIEKKVMFIQRKYEKQNIQRL
jgi:hypothetical protein